MLDTTQARFYLMETHYYNPSTSGDSGTKGATDDNGTVTRQKADNSGLKLYYTSKLRKHDAGVLSIGEFCVNSAIMFVMREILLYSKQI